MEHETCFVVGWTLSCATSVWYDSVVICVKGFRHVRDPPIAPFRVVHGCLMLLFLRSVPSQLYGPKDAVGFTDTHAVVRREVGSSGNEHCNTTVNRSLHVDQIRLDGALRPAPSGSKV
jgi:hypothetical protein